MWLWRALQTHAWGAWGAALLPVLGLPLLIGAQFLWAAWANRGDPQRPGWQALLRAWWAECKLALRLFGWLQPFRAQAWSDQVRQTPGRRGVVLVHGFGCNRAVWTDWLRDLRASGRCHVAVNLEPPWGPVERHVATLEAAVQQVHRATGVPPLVVCHSMGGLVAQAWLWAGADAPHRVHGIVTFGTPYGGTGLARADLLGLARQMRPGHAWLRVQDPTLPAACRLRFTCWYSLCDNIVFPAARACLPGAQNRPAHALAHVEMVFDPVLRRETLAMLEEESEAPTRGPGTTDAHESPPPKTGTGGCPISELGKTLKSRPCNL